ncbi:MAG TPA: hypothetical protein VKA84_05005 [Gemmatimonadaceae bacterium]|nr:hypothetical protein [Gemmatimonadaceae bacterium]
MRRHTTQRLALALCLAASAGLRAQGPDTTGGRRDTTARPPRPRTADSAERPFVRGGVYDKPYQTRLLGRTAIGGYAEAHARLEHVDGLRDEAGFEAKRFNIFTATRVSDFVRIGAELEFEDGGREIKLEYAAIDLRLHPSLTLRGGMLLSPLGKFNLSHDSPLNEFTDRPVVSTELLGVALSEPGFGAFGQFGLGRTGRLIYEVYGTNGFHDGLIMNSPEGTRIALGRGNFEDNNGSPAVVGRLAWSPRVGYELGVSAHHGAYNVFNLEGTQTDKRRDLTIAVVDAEATVAGVQLGGEAATASISIPEGLRGIYAARQRGFYVEAVRPFGRAWVRTMRNSTFAAKARFDLVDFDAQQVGQVEGQLSVGVNFRPTSDSVLKLDYVRGKGRDRFNNLAEHARVLASIATYF